MVESQGKVSEKSGNFEKDIEWQPCNSLKLPQLKKEVRGIRETISLQSPPSFSPKARIFLLVDLWEIFFRFRVEGTKK